MKKNQGIALGLWCALLAAGFSCLAARGQKPMTAVDGSELAKFLMIDLPGYQSPERPEVKTMDLGEAKVSIAARSFIGETSHLEITIVDGARLPAADLDFKSLEKPAFEPGRGKGRKISFQGFPGVERYAAAEKTAEVLILVADRFLVDLEHEDVPDVAATVRIAGLLDLAGLAALAK